MSRRFPCCVPGCLVCRPDRWREDWDRYERRFDPGYQRRKAVREAEQQRRSAELLRQLVEQAERDRRENDPRVN